MKIIKLSFCSALFAILINCIITMILIPASNACSCMLSHPQEHYCSADFVAIIHVKRLAKLSTVDGRTLSYQIRVRKEFKSSPKAKNALSHGLIWTSGPGHGTATCGRKLKSHTRYLITGTVNGEKAWISLCNFVQEVSSLTSKQLKGFRKLYAMGCKCKVRQSSNYPFFKPFNKSYKTLMGRNGYCNWETKWDNDDDCQGLTSMCVPVSPNSHECHWVNSNSYRTCMKRRKETILNKNQIEREEP